jgi:hypothetical protein
MDTNGTAANWAKPPFFFHFNKLLSPKHRYILKVFEHAHVVLCFVPFIELFYDQFKDKE